MHGDLKDLIYLSQKEMFQILTSSETGLSSTEAKKRIEEFGYNELSKIQKHSIIIESLARSVNPLFAVLIISAIISGVMGNAISASIIILMVILSVAIDYIQSHRSFVEVEKLKASVAAKVTTLRDNKWEDILAREIVPGDIIYLSAGDLIPADSILITAKDLHVQQAALTGESLPIEKEVNTNEKKIESVFESMKVVFSGSSVVSGIATAVVVSTGLHTELGKIAKSLSLRPPKTEIDRDANIKFKNIYETFSAQGYRVLAVAYREVTSQVAYRAQDELSLTLLGFLVFCDPPLVDAAEVINLLKEMKVNVKILTGDNELVTQTICRQVGSNLKKTVPIGLQTGIPIGQPYSSFNVAAD